MKLFHMIAEWLRKRGLLAKRHVNVGKEDRAHFVGSTDDVACVHGGTKDPFMIEVLGFECYFDRGGPMCPDCTQMYLNEYSTLCASCKHPIFPTMPVAIAWSGAQYPFTHLDMECCISFGLHCGVWGNGVLIPLHELYPEKYPPGTSSVISHVFNTGESVIHGVPADD